VQTIHTVVIVLIYFFGPLGPQRLARVRRLGVLSPQQKRDFYAGIDVFALPSRSDSFGMVLLEAWANGVPNLGYRAGGIAELIRPGEDGLLVRCGEVRDLAEALDQLIADKSLRIRLGASGRNRAHRDFQWKDKLDRVRSTYQEVVDELLGRRKKKRRAEDLSLPLVAK